MYITEQFKSIFLIALVFCYNSLAVASVTSNPFDNSSGLYNLIYAGVGGESDTRGFLEKCHVGGVNNCQGLDNPSSPILELIYANNSLYAGLNNGIIWKCDPNSVNSCFNLAASGSPIRSLLYTNNYIYAGLDDGRMWRCNPNSQNSCDTSFNTAGQGINALVTANDSIYAGLNDGTLWKCDPNKKDSCQVLDKSASPIKSLVATNNSIYAGRADGIMWKCDPGIKNFCTELNTAAMNNGIATMVAANGAVYAGMDDGTLWKCDPNNKNSCQSLDKAGSGIKSFLYDPVSNVLYAGVNDGSLWKCDPTLANACQTLDSFGDYGSVNGLVGLPFTQKSFILKTEYNQPNQGIPQADMAAYEVTADKSGNLIYVQSGKLVTSVTTTSACPTDSCGWGTIPEMDYVILTTGRMYAVNQLGAGCPENQGRFYEMLKKSPVIYSCKSKNERTSHAGIAISANYNTGIPMVMTNSNTTITVPIITAGRISVTNGKVASIDNCSGHFKPTNESLLYALQYALPHKLAGFNTGPYDLRKVTGQNCFANDAK